MTRKLIFALSVAAFTASTALADNTQTVSVNGATVDKIVEQITFEGDYIVLHFTDGTTEQSDDFKSVKIEFSVATAIRTLNRDSSNAPVQVFDMTGKLVSTMKTADASQLDALGKGVYMIRKGKQTIKLIKN